MGRVYICENENCDNDEEYDSPGQCPKCGEELTEILEDIKIL